jgi:hypothetical protein
LKAGEENGFLLMFQLPTSGKFRAGAAWKGMNAQVFPGQKALAYDLLIKFSL